MLQRISNNEVNTSNENYLADKSDLFAVYDGSKMLYLIEQYKSGELKILRNEQNIAKCTDGSLLYDKDFIHREVEKDIDRLLLQEQREKKDRRRVYKNLYQAHINTFETILHYSHQNGFHEFVKAKNVMALEKLILNTDKWFNEELPENFTDLLELCQYVSNKALREENKQAKELESELELQEILSSFE